MSVMAEQILSVAHIQTEDEALDPMSNVLDDTGPGQLAPRNMSAWIFRGTTAVLGGVFRTQDASGMDRAHGSEMMRNACIQTEPPQMKDASAMIIDGQLESERLANLDINIPLPAELPVLTTSQLLELERRLGDLMSRLEDEIVRAEGEVKRRKEQDAEMEKREAAMHSNRFGKWQTNGEWALQMRNRIELRLNKRHGFADVPSLPTQKRNLDSTLMSPLRSSRTARMEEENDMMMIGDGMNGRENDDPFSFDVGGNNNRGAAPAVGGESFAVPPPNDSFVAFRS